MTSAAVRPPAFWAELETLLRLAGPIVGAQLSMMLLNVVDTMMVGHIGIEAMAAAALATQWASVTLMFGMGLVTGIDPLISQAYGSGKREEVARGLHQGLWVGLGASLLVATSWLFLEPLLIVWGQSEELARNAQNYLTAQLPSVPFFMLTVALRSYLQNRGITMPGFVVMALANVLNVLFNWLFIFGAGAFAGWGLLGAGIATSCSRIIVGIGLWAYVWKFGLHAGYWLPITRASFTWKRTRRTLALGIPIGLSYLSEVLAFSGSTFVAAKLGNVATSAHVIVLNLAALNFMVPLGIALAAAARVGHHIGHGNQPAMLRTIRVALICGATFMAALGVILMFSRHLIPRLYTDAEAVIAVAVAAFPVVAAFQVADGVQVVAAGVLRGMGRTRIAMAGNLVGYYVLGLPIGIWLAFDQQMGVPGIWWGLLIGLCFVATTLLFWVYRVRHRPLELTSA